jgi:hypothetical protein
MLPPPPNPPPPPPPPGGAAVWTDIAARPPAERPAAPEVENTAPFEEEVALLGKQHGEARQIDLLLVDFYLCEVGVVRQIRCEVGRDAVFRVDAQIARWIVRQRRRRLTIRADPANGVRLQLEIGARRRKVEANERCRLRDPKHPGLPAHRSRKRREVSELVLVANHAPELHAPHLRPPRVVAD